MSDDHPYARGTKVIVDDHNGMPPVEGYVLASRQAGSSTYYIIGSRNSDTRGMGDIAKTWPGPDGRTWTVVDDFDDEDGE